MALQLVLDSPTRLILEPGYFQTFSAYTLARSAQPADTASARQLWHLPGMGCIMLKPLQLQDDFLNHTAQRTSGCLLRIATADFNVSPVDTAAATIWEADVGSSDNPWIFHTPATSALAGPTLPPVGITPFYSLTSVANTSEMGMTTSFLAAPGATPAADGERRFPGDLVIPGSTGMDMRQLVTTTTAFPENQGFLFRWHFPNPQLTPHQTIYAFVFGQFLLLCRSQLVEVFRDISVAQDKSKWSLEYKANLFAPGGGLPSPTSPDWGFGQSLIAPSVSEDRSLMVIPYHRNKILIMASTGASITLRVRNDPQLLTTGTDYDITQASFVYVWALTGVPGRFQIQKVKYEPGPAILNLPPLVTEYTPASPPFLLIHADVFHDESLSATLQDPKLYTFAESATSNDCPPATSDGTGQSRTYGVTLTFGSSPDQVFSPQFYSVDIEAAPQFMDNPASPTTVSDTSPDSRVMSADISMGVNPGQGQMTARVLDVGLRPLAPYYYRSQMPVDLVLNGTTVFKGYTEQIEADPLRETGAPWEVNFRAQDRWLLLQETFLRDQRDYTGVGHITVVDKIARQCGIDTGSLPARENAEYPNGWEALTSDIWDTPLGTPIVTADNLEASSLLGWKPQLLDTGDTYLKRIADYFSGWLMGFRSNGNLFYLPYDYFTSPTVVFSPLGSGSAPYYRNPVEHRTIEPSGNVIQVISRYTVDQTVNKSGIFVDWASLKNPAAPNFLGRYKWQIVEVNGSFTCPQLNAMAYIVFKRSRRRLKRISIHADYVPGFEIGHMATVTGYGDYRMIEFRGQLVKGNWEVATYTLESTEKGYM